MHCQLRYVAICLAPVFLCDCARTCPSRCCPPSPLCPLALYSPSFVTLLSLLGMVVPLLALLCPPRCLSVLACHGCTPLISIALLFPLFGILPPSFPLFSWFSLFPSPFWYPFSIFSILLLFVPPRSALPGPCPQSQQAFKHPPLAYNRSGVKR